MGLMASYSRKAVLNYNTWDTTVFPDSQVAIYLAIFQVSDGFKKSPLYSVCLAFLVLRKTVIHSRFFTCRSWNWKSLVVFTYIFFCTFCDFRFYICLWSIVVSSKFQSVDISSKFQSVDWRYIFLYFLLKICKSNCPSTIIEKWSFFFHLVVFASLSKIRFPYTSGSLSGSVGLCVS